MRLRLFERRQDRLSGLLESGLAAIFDNDVLAFDHHRDDNFKIVKGMDHLLDAMRYAVMMRRHGRGREDYEGVGYGPMPYAAQNRDRRPRQQMARNVNFDLFTGGEL